jgi:transposase-like protein
MSDRFDINSKRKLESNPGEAARNVSAVRRIELITGAFRRRQWSSDEKARTVMESLRPGANVSEGAPGAGLSHSSYSVGVAWPMRCSRKGLRRDRPRPFNEAKVRAFIGRDHDRSGGYLGATIHGTLTMGTRSLIRSNT